MRKMRHGKINKINGLLHPVSTNKLPCPGDGDEGLCSQLLHKCANLIQTICHKLVSGSSEMASK